MFVGQRSSGRHVLVVGASLLCAGAVAAQSDVFLYPEKGQSAEQQQKDKMECAMWANEQTGFNPTTPAPTPDQFASGQPVTQGGAVKGAARGAAVGAVGGAIAGDAGKGAAVGAGAGAVGGGMRRRGAKREAEQTSEQAYQAALAEYNQKRATYQRAWTACLEGRDYTVK
jgi:hypothetical protein